MSDEKALAIDVGGGHATCAVVAGHSILDSTHLPIADARTFGVLLPALADALRALLRHCRVDASECAGLALSFPGIVDPFAGRVFSTPKGKYDDACSLDLPGWARDAFGLPLRIENDARMALLGERHAGAARGYADVVIVTLGTGIGGAAMIGGRLLRGRHFQAGCLGGHLPVSLNGRPCICGNVGCVEAEASTWSLPEICHGWPEFASSALAREPVLDFGALFRSSATGDPIAVAIRDRCLHVWAAGAVGLVHAYDPELLVFGGSVMKSAEQILPALADYVGWHAWTPWGKPELRAATLGTDAALLGAIPLLEEAC